MGFDPMTCGSEDRRDILTTLRTLLFFWYLSYWQLYNLLWFDLIKFSRMYGFIKILLYVYSPTNDQTRVMTELHESMTMPFYLRLIHIRDLVLWSLGQELYHFRCHRSYLSQCGFDHAWFMVTIGILYLSSLVLLSSHCIYLHCIR